MLKSLARTHQANPRTAFEMNFEISSQDLVLQRRSSVLLDEALCPAISTFTLQDHVEVIHHSREEFYEMVSKEVLNREKCSAACLTVNKIATQLKENVPWRTQTTTPITKKQNKNTDFLQSYR